MEFRIGGMVYFVEDASNLARKHDAWGKVYYDTCKIEIEEELCENRKKEVIVHELLHAMFHEAGFSQQDEEVINRVGLILHRFLQDNDLSIFREE